MARRRLGRVTAALIAVVGVVSLGACTDDAGDDPSAFCDELNRRADPLGTEGDVAATVEDLEVLGRLAPDAVDDVIDQITAVFEEVRDAPDDAAAREILTTRSEELATLSERLLAYTDTTCGLDLRRPAPTPTPTPNEVLPLEPA